MNFDFTPDEQQRFDRILSFAREHASAPDAVSESGFSRTGWQRLASFGLTGIPLPESCGGRSEGAFATSRAIEALTTGGLDSGLVFALCAHLFTCAVPIWKAGSQAQWDEFLKPLGRGDWVGANATTEPDVGSDLSALQTSASKRGDRYLLAGTKYFASNAPVADVFVIYANVRPGSGYGGLTAFIVRRDTPGLHIQPAQPKVGLEGSPFSQVVFDACEIPETQRLGAEGAGSAIFAESMRWERTCLFALYLGSMQRQLDRAVKYVRSRKQFGQSIGKFQSVANRVVDMKLRLETARLLLYRAAWLLDQGRRCDLDIALSKLHVSECAVQSGLDAIQLHGGRGCLTEFGVERDLRDAIPSRIFSGTSEVQRVIVARSLGL